MLNRPDVIRIIENKLSETGENIIIAIDGRCGAGKTTLSELIEKNFDCNVIHMDDFFLQPHQRTKDRLETPGGNVDAERFKAQVIDFLKTGKDFSYELFDCRSLSLSGKRLIEAKRLTVIEGTYSLHPLFGKYYDISFYVTTESSTQKERIIKRNPQKAEMFFTKWIPMEEKYFDYFNIKADCDYIVNT